MDEQAELQALCREQQRTIDAQGARIRELERIAEALREENEQLLAILQAEHQEAAAHA